MKLNIFKTIKINSLRRKKERLLSESNLYSVTNRKKSDELYKQAIEIEDKLLSLIAK